MAKHQAEYNGYIDTDGFAWCAECVRCSFPVSEWFKFEPITHTESWKTITCFSCDERIEAEYDEEENSND